MLEALARAGVVARRGKTGEDLVLQRARIGVDQRRRQLALVGVAAIERALPDTGRAGDLLHRDGVDALGREQPRRRVEDARAITSGVGAFVHDLRLPIGRAGPAPLRAPAPAQLASQALTLLRVRRDPLLRCVVRLHLLAGDHHGDGVLILRRPAELLDRR